MIAGIDDQPLNPPDRPVLCVDVLAPAHLDLTRGYTVLGDRVGACTHAAHAHAAAHAPHTVHAAAQAHDEPVVGPREHLILLVPPPSTRAREEMGLLGVLERFELASGASEPDLVRRR